MTKIVEGQFLLIREMLKKFQPIRTLEIFAMVRERKNERFMIFMLRVYVMLKIIDRK